MREERRFAHRVPAPEVIYRIPEGSARLFVPGELQWVGSCKVGGKLLVSGGAGKGSTNSPSRRPLWTSSTLPPSKKPKLSGWPPSSPKKPRKRRCAWLA